MSYGHGQNRPMNYGLTVADAIGTPSPQLHAIVLVEADEGYDLTQLPSKPWPRYVRLSREAQPDVVSLVVGTLATWGREKADWSIEALEREFPAAIPGGIAAVDQGKLIGPSCCCGLETWREWLDVLNTRRTPSSYACRWNDGGRVSNTLMIQTL